MGATGGRREIGFFSGLAYPLRGARIVYLRHAGLSRLWLPPLAIVTVLMALVTWLAVAYHVELFELVWASPAGDALQARLLRSLHAVASFAFAALLVVAGAALVLLASPVIAAPWNDALSAAVERIARGGAMPEPGGSSFLRDTLRSVAFAATLLASYAFSMVVLLVVGWAIPVVGPPLQAAIAFVVTAAFLALEHMDLAAARHGLSVRARLSHVRRHLASALGLGTAIWGLMLVPLLNLLLVPAAVAGATLWFLDTHDVAARMPSTPP